MTDSASFSYTLTDAEGNALYFADGTYTADPSAAGASSTVIVKGGETVVLEGVPAGTYRITGNPESELHHPGNQRKQTTEYTTDYVVKTKQDGDIPVAVFTNTKLTERAPCVCKNRIRHRERRVSDPQVRIYAADSEGNKTEMLFGAAHCRQTVTLSIRIAISPQGRYVIEESGAEAEGL